VERPGREGLAPNRFATSDRQFPHIDSPNDILGPDSPLRGRNIAVQKDLQTPRVQSQGER